MLHYNLVVICPTSCISLTMSFSLGRNRNAICRRLDVPHARTRPSRLQACEVCFVLLSRLCEYILRKRTRYRACLALDMASLADPLSWAFCPSGSSSSWSGSAFVLAPPGLVRGRARLKAELCHHRFCVAWVRVPRQSGVTLYNSGSARPPRCRIQPWLSARARGSRSASVMAS